MSDLRMDHASARECLDALALDALDPAERRAVEAHVASCAECAGELVESRAAVSALALGAPPAMARVPGRAAIRERLLARAADSKGVAFPTPAAKAAARRGPQTLAIAAGVLLMASAAFGASLWRDREELRSALANLTRKQGAAAYAADSLRMVVAVKDSVLGALTGRDMAVMRLTSDARREAWALMFWNRGTNAWTFVAHNLAPPKAGRTYQLWLVTAGAKISAGIFAPGINGEAIVRAVYPLSRDSLKAVAVTDEPAGGVAQPTGPFVIIGAESLTR